MYLLVPKHHSDCAGGLRAHHCYSLLDAAAPVAVFTQAYYKATCLCHHPLHGNQPSFFGSISCWLLERKKPLFPTAGPWACPLTRASSRYIYCVSSSYTSHCNWTTALVPVRKHDWGIDLLTGVHYWPKCPIFILFRNHYIRELSYKLVSCRQWCPQHLHTKLILLSCKHYK